MIRPLITVVVCTFNRASLLRTCLQSLVEQSVDVSCYEVVVVNNNSTDSTPQVVKEFSDQRSNFSGVVEKTQGLANARNSGWRIASGEYVAYIDDDCKAPPEWIAVAKEIIEQVSPTVFGGPNFAFYNTPKPPWYKDIYSSTTLGDHSRVLSAREHLIGNNIFFQHTILDALGGFNSQLGMIGDKIAYGEETEMVMRIRSTMNDAITYYEPRLYVYHLVRPEKMRLDWTVSQSFASGWYSAKVFKVETSRSFTLWRSLLLETMLLIKDVSWSVLWRDRTRYPYWQNFFYEVVCRHLIKLGEIVEQLQRKLLSS
ncbi:MAG: glycosyltransferase family 2 protein [Chloroflexi bacterium]|nr:glycosyltransferase family 2 protein [Chloroflexota bacterium]MBI5713088.1 glycosyltransferase family 2 protein [Chloroflexota bacterium]